VTSDVWAKFTSLAPSGEAGAGAAFPCANSGHLIVKGGQGEPTLLLATQQRRSPRAPIHLKHVEISFDRRFEVVADGASATQHYLFCKVRCVPDVPHLFPHFVELMAATAAANPTHLSQDQVDSLIEALLDLFRKLATPLPKVVSGLWAELLVISQASDPGAFVDAWHLESTDLFDFAFPNLRLEVKSSTLPARQHEFSLRQLSTDGVPTFIASVLLTRSASGSSVLDLAREISERLTDAQREKIWRHVLQALGPDAESVQGQLFDRDLARKSLALVNAQAVPTVHVPEEHLACIGQVRFVADITLVCQQNHCSIESVAALAAG